MAFYNKGAKATWVTTQGPGGNNTKTYLDDVPLGGFLTVTLTVGSGINSQILVDPGPGFSYRLHSWTWRPAATPVSGDLFVWNNAQTVYADDLGSATKPGGYLGGIVTQSGNGIWFFNNTNQTVVFYLQYDRIVQPVIS